MFEGPAWAGVPAGSGPPRGVAVSITWSLPTQRSAGSSLGLCARGLGRWAFLVASRAEREVPSGGAVGRSFDQDGTGRVKMEDVGGLMQKLGRDVSVGQAIVKHFTEKHEGQAPASATFEEVVQVLKIIEVEEEREVPGGEAPKGARSG